jgi:SPOR domain
MLRQLVFLTCLMTTLSLTAQDMQVSEDPVVGQLFQAWVRSNRANARLQGWRVQLLSTTDRTMVEERKTRFRLQYPDIPADWIHEKPYYKLRAGAFTSKLEAQAFAATLRDAWPGAYPAKDNAIHPRDFLKQ